VFATTTERPLMDALNPGSLSSHSVAAHDRAPLDPRWVFGFVLAIIGVVAAISGVVVAVMMGQTTVAIIIGIVAGAFFARIAV
jgi:hypothetical protein